MKYYSNCSIVLNYDFGIVENNIGLRLELIQIEIQTEIFVKTI